MNNLCFVKQLIKKPKQVGAFSQSSRMLARRIAESISDRSRIVELGAGTGVVTREILKRLGAQGRLTSFEIDPSFCECLRAIHDDRLTVVNANALQCASYVDDFDCVVSALPLAWFTPEDTKVILDLAHRAGRFIQIQYVPMLTRQMHKQFADVQLKFVAQNLPPAFVYVCEA